ncbi:MAG: hypothetical protein NC541_01260 [bacterium]|nr:hypothetical protein [bacterium]
MNAYLLYPKREWENVGRYTDERAIMQDLGLKALFHAAARELEKEEGKVKAVGEGDPFLEDVMKKVMLVPLTLGEEIRYRQKLLEDCFAQEDFIRELYGLATEILKEWDRIGRRTAAKNGTRNSPRALVGEIHVLELFVRSLKRLKALFAEYQGKLHADGWRLFYERLCAEFSDETEANLERILQDILFYANLNDEEAQKSRDNSNGRFVDKPRMVIGCGVGDGLKLEDFKLGEVSTEVRRYRKPGSAIVRVQDYMNQRTKTALSVRTDLALLEQTGQLEFEVVRHIVLCCEPFQDAFGTFFDRLRFQTAFYRGAVNLRHFMERFGICSCFPTVGTNDTLRFRELKEVVMGLVQHMDPVGNTCEIDGKRLMLVTGANQGGKSTFLRSIGIAQIMLQCGLPVAAQSYESGIFPSFFTHFTRREDSAMNSGRLDEELGRMEQIVNRLEDVSLVLLNESFATTTEKEGSVIAYDIVRALTESGVKVLMVTHLLSFATRVYEEREDWARQTAFLSAQRTESGKRTYKMVEQEPQLTSFGLELYDEIIGDKKG